MNEHQEIEIKLWVKNLNLIEELLLHKNAKLLQPKTYEVNLRFDTQKGELSSAGKALRLRKDKANFLTYKGPSSNQAGARARTEIQTVVVDFEATRAILEELGYQVWMTYEKYRTEYEWEDTRIALDEMPFGTFVEIEGQDPRRIHTVCEDLGLNWDRRIPWSYVEIFLKICNDENFPQAKLTFEIFKTRVIRLENYGIFAADELIER